VRDSGSNPLSRDARKRTGSPQSSATTMRHHQTSAIDGRHGAKRWVRHVPPAGDEASERGVREGRALIVDASPHHGVGRDTDREKAGAGVCCSAPTPREAGRQQRAVSDRGDPEPTERPRRTARTRRPTYKPGGATSPSAGQPPRCTPSPHRRRTPGGNRQDEERERGRVPARLRAPRGAASATGVVRVKQPARQPHKTAPAE